MIQRETHRRHQPERRNDGGGNGHRGDQRGADVGKKQVDDHGGEDAALHQVALNGIDGCLDKHGLIADNLRSSVFRQCRRNLPQAPLHLVRRRHGVLAGLLGHHQGDGRDTVQPGRAARFFVAVLGVTDVAHLHGVAISIGHRYFVELRRVHHSAGGAHSKLLRAGVQVSARQFHVLQPQCVEDIGGRQVVGAQALRVYQYMDLAPRAADDGDFAHALRVLEFLLDLLVGDHGDVAQRARRRHGNLHDGRGVRVELLHHRLFRALRKIGDDEIHLVLNLLRGHVAVLG